jgi:hypothetical protein
MTAGSQIHRRLATDRFLPSLGVNLAWIGWTASVQRDGGNDWNLVFTSSTYLRPRSFSAEIGVNNLDLSPQNVDFLSPRHGPQNLVASSQAVS